MTRQFRPAATFEDGVLRLIFRDPDLAAAWRDIEVVVDVDESGDPSGLEIIGVCDTLGSNAVLQLAESLAGSDIRFSYDDAVDAAIIGVDIASGSRVRGSIPKRGRAGLGADGRWVALEVMCT